MNLLALGIILILIFPILLGMAMLFEQLNIEFKEFDVSVILSIVIATYAVICVVSGIMLIIITTL